VNNVMPNIKITRADLDRYEDNYAVLIVEDGATEEVHKALLPAGLKPGSKLIISVEFDENATKDAESKVDWLLKELKARGERLNSKL
jgi:phosphoserine aminotransferase